MECEVCGKATNSPIQIELDSVFVWTCGECARLGKPVSKAKIPLPRLKKEVPVIAFDEGLDLVLDLGRKVREAREKKGMTLEELAKKLYEKESLLQKIEQGFVPSPRLVEKLEKTLGLQLKEREGN
ncbi:MAG: multiprotein-bridging factor 1 family protein [Candidatus Diapherotrites archaeon]